MIDTHCSKSYCHQCFNKACKSNCSAPCKLTSDCHPPCSHCLSGTSDDFVCGRGCSDNIYEHCVDLTAWYSFSWTVNNSVGTPYIDARVILSQIAWIGFGLSPTGEMPNSDFIIGYQSNTSKNLLVGDFFRLESTSGFPELDVDLGGTDDILAYNITVDAVNQLTILTWKRYLDTGDKYDLPIPKAPARVLWANGDTTSLSYHGVLNRGGVAINFFSGELLDVFD